jgi:hypothetical protein
MSDFFNRRDLVARKPHRCDQCRKMIPVGERHTYSAGRFDGDFQTSREHIECREAWIELARVREVDWWDPRPFLFDDELEREDREWLKSAHPSVASRLFAAPPATTTQPQAVS